MAELRTPSDLNFSDTNMSDAWGSWLQKLQIYMTASNRIEDPEGIKIAVLLNLIGDEGVKLYNTFKNESTDTYNTVIAKFDKHFKPKKNVIYERFKFYKYTQEEEQPFNSFLTELKKLASTCEFKEENNMIWDKIVLEISEDALRDRLLCEPELTLDKAIEACINFEVRKKQSGEMSKRKEVKIEEIARPGTTKTDKQCEIRASTGENRNSPRNIYRCYKCGREHERYNCPAYGKPCAKCGQLGHFAKKCRGRNQYNQPKQQKKFWKQNFIGVKGESSDSDEGENLYLDAIAKEGKMATTSWYQQVKIRGHRVKFKIDTGAECNVIPLSIIKIINVPLAKIQETDVHITTYGEHKIKPQGTIILKSEVKGQIVNIKYIVADVGSKPILGLNTCTRLKLIKRLDSIKTERLFANKEQVITNYKEVFKGLGKFPGKPHKLSLKDDSVPVARPARRIAKSLLPKLKEELDRLERDGVIKKVEGPTEWLHPLVIKEKPNKTLRICLDPNNLNNALKEERFQLPTQDEMLSDLHGKTLFSTLDLRDSFYQVPIDDVSSELCAFATPFNRYRFTRMPFGIKTAAEVFQKKNTELFGDIPGTKIYIDDIFIAGNETDHDQILKKVLERAKETGITFNEGKFQFRKDKIKILGHIVSKEGISIDPERVEAIVKMNKPNNRKELLRFLGVVKYVGKFIPGMSKVMAPLRELARENVKWEWKSEQKLAFNAIKQLLAESSSLEHYDDKKTLTIQTDASQDGMGSVLMQEGKPIAYASRAMTQSERKFAQIEKELLAICFATEKFHYYIYGREIKIQTDHKPLVSICKREMNKVPTRLQRMLMRLLKYNLQIEYLRGTEMVIADALSRAYLKNQEADNKEAQWIIHETTQQINMSEGRKKQFAMAVTDDAILTEVIVYIKQGWPKEMKKLGKAIQPYCAIREELMTTEGLIMYGDKVIVPRTLQKEMLKLVHAGHQGETKTKLRARQLLYWPTMNAEIEKFVKNCNVCQLHRNNNPREPLLQYEIPENPWERIAMDIATYNGRDYLVIMDYYSKWLEGLELKGKTAGEIIRTLMKVFAVQGFPTTIVSDNVPFNSKEFRTFLKTHDIKGITSSPNYPRSNGLAERAVGIVKKMLKKSKVTGEALDYFLMEYRCSPVVGLNLSPAQIQLGRQIRGMVPGLTKHFEPCQKDASQIRMGLMQRQAQQKRYYDRGTKLLPQIETGDRVIFKKEKRWERGQVLAPEGNPRSHILKDENGQLYRRNRHHIVPVLKEERDKEEEWDEEKESETREKDGYDLRDRNTLKCPARYVDQVKCKKGGCNVGDLVCERHTRS